MNGDERHISDEILVKYLLDEATDSERKQVQRWLKASEDNKKYFAGFRLIWNESRALTFNSDADTDEAWGRFLQRTQQNVPAPTRKVSYRWAKIAAALLFLMGGGWLGYVIFDSSNQKQMAYEAKPAPVIDKIAPKTESSAETVPVNDGGKTDPEPVPPPQSPANHKSLNETATPVADKQALEKTETRNEQDNGKPKTEYSHAVGSSVGLASASNKSVAESNKKPETADLVAVSPNVYQASATKKMVEMDQLEKTVPVTENKPVKAEKKVFMAQKGSALKSKASFMNTGYSEGLFKYDRTNDFICNSTPCPIEICIVQTVKCANGEPSAVSTCSVLEPDESGQLRYKALDKITKNCQTTVEEIRIKRVSTGETIILNADSKPATAQEFFSYITGQKKGDITAGIFHTDCDNNKDDCGLLFDNSKLILQ